jgi:hypothetical protein
MNAANAQYAVKRAVNLATIMESFRVKDAKQV